MTNATNNHCPAAASASAPASPEITTREHERPVLSKRVLLEETAANAVADLWERDGLAWGAKVHSTGVFPLDVECNRHRFTLYVVLAYGEFPEGEEKT